MQRGFENLYVQEPAGCLIEYVATTIFNLVTSTSAQTTPGNYKEIIFMLAASSIDLVLVHY